MKSQESKAIILFGIVVCVIIVIMMGKAWENNHAMTLKTFEFCDERGYNYPIGEMFAGRIIKCYSMVNGSIIEKDFLIKEVDGKFYELQREN